MTSELKPCPFCGDKAEIERYGGRRVSTIYTCNSCGCSLETGEKWDHGTGWNTRAVPDVAELVRYRYDPWSNHGSAASLMAINPDGEYVRHDQAVAVVGDVAAEAELNLMRAETAEASNAAKDKEIAGLRKAVGKSDKALYRTVKSLRNTRTGYKLLQDKFAQSVNQEPIRAVKLADCVEHHNPHYGGGYFLTDDAVCDLYEAPVASDADLRAENERLKAEKAAMRKAATDYCWQRYKGRDPMNLSSPAVYTSHEWQKIGEAMDDAVTALNPSEPRT